MTPQSELKSRSVPKMFQSEMKPNSVTILVYKNWWIASAKLKSPMSALNSLVEERLLRFLRRSFLLFFAGT